MNSRSSVYSFSLKRKTPCEIKNERSQQRPQIRANEPGDDHSHERFGSAQISKLKINLTGEKNAEQRPSTDDCQPQPPIHGIFFQTIVCHFHKLILIGRTPFSKTLRTWNYRSNYRWTMIIEVSVLWRAVGKKWKAVVKRIKSDARRLGIWIFITTRTI